MLELTLMLYHPNINFVNEGDIQVDDDNLTNDQKSHHDGPIKKAPSEPSIEFEWRRFTR